MSDTKWVIQGGIGGSESSDPQKMTQGLGFPLRPVRGAPPPGTGEIFNEETIAVGSRMEFFPLGWESGKVYLPGACVTNGTWTMVATNATYDNPFPVADGAPTYGLPSFTPTQNSHTGVVYSGHTYIFTEPCVLKEIRIWVPELTSQTNYRVVALWALPSTDPYAAVIEEPILNENAWSTVSLGNTLVPVGTQLLLYIDAYASSGGTPFQGIWERQSNSNNGSPNTAHWRTRSNKSELRFHVTDKNAIDRRSELMSVGINSTITITQSDANDKSITFVTEAPAVDLGSYVEWQCRQVAVGPGGEPDEDKNDDCVFDVPTFVNTSYVEEAAGLSNPAWATVSSFLRYDGVDQSPPPTTAFGVDLRCDIATFSDKWAVFSFNQP